MLDKNTKIYIAGHRGLVGSAIWKNLENRGYHNLVGRTHAELDLADQRAVEEFFKAERPEAVVLAAAFVGGIMANSLYRADFIMQNLKMQCNVIDCAYRYKAKKLLFLGSTCIYPKNAPQPMGEDALLTSPLEYTNEEYAIAKIAGLKMCESYNLQYGTNYIAVMPTNLYGPNDNFHLENSHVLPAMMRKFYLAKCLHENDWEAVRHDMEKRPINPPTTLAETIGEGNVGGQDSEERILAALQFFRHRGQPGDALGRRNAAARVSVERGHGRRQRLSLAQCRFQGHHWHREILQRLLRFANGRCGRSQQLRGTRGAIPALGEIRNCHINVGTGKELTIRALAKLVARTVGFKGTIVWDCDKPNGTPRKLIDVSKLHSLGWQHRVEIEEGVAQLYDWYRHA